MKNENTSEMILSMVRIEKNNAMWDRIIEKDNVRKASKANQPDTASQPDTLASCKADLTEKEKTVMKESFDSIRTIYEKIDSLIENRQKTHNRMTAESVKKQVEKAMAESVQLQELKTEWIEYFSNRYAFFAEKRIIGKNKKKLESITAVINGLSVRIDELNSAIVDLTAVYESLTVDHWKLFERALNAYDFTAQDAISHLCVLAGRLAVSARYKAITASRKRALNDFTGKTKESDVENACNAGGDSKIKNILNEFYYRPEMGDNAKNLVNAASLAACEYYAKNAENTEREPFLIVGMRGTFAEMEKERHRLTIKGKRTDVKYVPMEYQDADGNLCVNDDIESMNDYNGGHGHGNHSYIETMIIESDYKEYIYGFFNRYSDEIGKGLAYKALKGLSAGLSLRDTAKEIGVTEQTLVVSVRRLQKKLAKIDSMDGKRRESEFIDVYDYFVNCI